MPQGGLDQHMPEKWQAAAADSASLKLEHTPSLCLQWFEVMLPTSEWLPVRLEPEWQLAYFKWHMIAGTMHDVVCMHCFVCKQASTTVEWIGKVQAPAMPLLRGVVASQQRTSLW